MARGGHRKTDHVPTNVIVLAIVALFAIASALIFALAIAGDYTNTAPIVMTLVGAIVSTVPALLALTRAEQTKQAVREELPHKVAEEITRDLPVVKIEPPDTEDGP